VIWPRWYMLLLAILAGIVVPTIGDVIKLGIEY
jgi:hypothetical protein